MKKNIKALYDYLDTIHDERGTIDYFTMDID